jgi:hypothetical protein
MSIALATDRESCCSGQGSCSPYLSSALLLPLWFVPAACRDQEQRMAVSLRPQAPATRHQETCLPLASPLLLPSACDPMACRTFRIRPAMGRRLHQAAGLIPPRRSSRVRCKPASPLRRPHGYHRGRCLQAVPRDKHGTA